MLWLACVVAWVLGGVPFGLVIVRVLCGIDIRRVGSGNVGATNASRVFAGKARLGVFIGIYLLDFLKGFVPAFWFAQWFGLGAEPLVAVLCGASAVLGHCASPFLKLRGGKGVATTTGVFAAVEPIALLAALAAFGMVLALTRKVFWGSLALGLTLPVVAIGRAPDEALNENLPVTVLAVVVALFLIWTHRSNLREAFAKQGDNK